MGCPQLSTMTSPCRCTRRRCRTRSTSAASPRACRIRQLCCSPTSICRARRRARQGLGELGCQCHIQDRRRTGAGAECASASDQTTQSEGEMSYLEMQSVLRMIVLKVMYENKIDVFVNPGTDHGTISAGRSARTRSERSRIAELLPGVYRSARQSGGRCSRRLQRHRLTTRSTC